ncbi:MAG: hypothetical protein JJU03_12600 [Idiomarina sp.]|nr:hypothetical protein [Idiomarina sp.]
MKNTLTDEQYAQIEKVTKEFSGQINSLESAIGAIFIGQTYGWRVLRMIHSANTLKKYEKILGLKYEDICPEKTEHSKRNVGFRVAEQIGRYWDVVMGRHKVDRKADADDKE